MYIALGVTALTYVLISLGVFGTLTVTEVVGYGETAIAEAARPALGDAGFTIMAIAALLATASSVNATLYASGGLTAMLAEVGQFPPFFGRGSRLGAHAGLLITSAIVLVVSNLVDLSAIASVGSACSLMIFLLVGVAGYRLRSETGALGLVVLLGIAATGVVLAFFAVDTLRNAPETFVAIVAIAALAVILDIIWKRVRPEPRRRQRRLSNPVAPRAAAPQPGEPSDAQARPPRSASDWAVEFLIRFTRTGHDAGYPTADLEDRVVALARALELEGVQVSATPTLVEVCSDRSRNSGRSRFVCVPRRSTWTRSPAWTTSSTT